MNCTHCGTTLPPGALFCGECGRSVASAPRTAVTDAGGQSHPVLRSAPANSVERRSAEVRQTTPARWVEDPVTGDSLTDDADEIDVELSAGDLRCEQCQNVMSSDDIFCGECGFVSRSITRAFSVSDFTGETRQLDLSPMTREPSIERVREFLPEPESESESELEPAPEPEPEPADHESDPGPEPTQEAKPEPRPLWAASRPELVVPPASLRPAAPSTPPAPTAPPAPPAAARQRFRDTGEYDVAGEYDDLEATRIVSRVSGDRFVLQFSTGESFTVHGSGLIGRNPQPEPGEFFEHLVRVLDTGKSVSKTHLEFGQEGGAFWVKDRFSGNGTIIREPDISARRAESDRRYRVIRGTRIDIGEQFFVVS
ncbi:double zinc ribbon domain-containing protein [Homoserinimonas sp. A520]